MRRRNRSVYLDFDFPEQLNFILDEAKLKVALCTRRAGKSYAAGCYLFRVAEMNPGCSVLYLALTSTSARNILWKDVLKVIDRKYNLGCEFRENQLTCTLPNGSVIYLLGADASEEQRAKLLGQKYALVVLDEAASYSIDLEDLVYGVLLPAVSDYRGTICMIGTPSNARRGLYYEITQGQNPSDAGTWVAAGGTRLRMKWKGHRWTWGHNPHVRVQLAEQVAMMKASNPFIEESPLYQQHWLGKWVTEDDARVYKYVAGKNDYERLPKYETGSWHYVLGIDLGFNDATAFTVLAYHDHDPVMYVVESTKQAKLDITATATRIQALDQRYGFESMVVDGAAKQAVEEMRRRHSLPLHSTAKQGKADFIDLLNAEMVTGRVKLSPACAVLVEEMSSLVWNTRGVKREELAGLDNHACDSMLYAWRYCHQYLSEKQRARPVVGSPEWYNEQAKDMERKEVERVEAMLREESESHIWEDYG